VVVFQARWLDRDLVFAKALYEKGIKLVFDTTDPHWDKNFDPSGIKKAKLEKILEYISLVTLSTNKLKESFLGWRKDKRVAVIPDSIDLDDHKQVKKHRDKKYFNICWFGCRSNVCQVNELAHDDLEKLGEEFDIKLIAVYDTNISGEVAPFDNIDLEIRDWSDEVTIESILESDVVINPRYDNWKKYKSNNKTIKGLALGVPVVERDFYAQIKKYLKSASLRSKDGKAGRIEAQKYDSKIIAKKVGKLYESLLVRQKSKNRIAVVTSIYGGYDTLHEPQYYEKDVDYIAFCDTVPKSDIWQVQYIDHTHFIQPRMTAKTYKILIHKYLPEYDWLVWIDGSVVLTGSVSEVINNLDADIGLFKHPFRDCVYEEYEASLKNTHHAKGEPASVRLRQKERYRTEGLPEKGGLYACTVMIRKNTKKVARFNEFWWSEISVASSSDQMPFVYSLWKNPLKVAELEGNFHESKWHKYIDHNYKAPEPKRESPRVIDKSMVYITYKGERDYNFSKIGIFKPGEEKLVKREYAIHLLESQPKLFICKDKS
jgi:hypothetical protein